MTIRRLMTESLMIAVFGVQFAVADDPSATRTGSASELGWLAQRSNNLKWEQVASVVESPRDICIRVRHHVRYQADLGDQHSGGRETWDRQYGDCEDLAACVLELCEKIGLEASIMVFRQKGSTEGHAVAMGLWNGKLWLSSNGWYTTVKSIDDARMIVSKEMRWREKNVQALSLAEIETKQEPGNALNVALSSFGTRRSR